MRTEIARQRLTPQVQSPPPSTHPPPTTHPPPSSALTTNNDSELVPGANNLIFRQLGNLDQPLTHHHPPLSRQTTIQSWFRELIISSSVNSEISTNHSPTTILRSHDKQRFRAGSGS